MREFWTTLDRGGVERAVQTFHAARRRDPDAFLFPEGVMNQAGYERLQAGKTKDAIALFTVNVEAYPASANAQDSLGDAYLADGQTDRALKQFELSLTIDPRHTKTMLNQGIVLAFGKQDLAGAEAKWKQVIELAPDSPEAQAARRGLEGIKAAGHPGAGTTPGS